MKVGDILRKKTARIATVRMNETVEIAAKLMRASNISALVVKDVVRTEGNTAVGMFTERDVVRAIADHGAAECGFGLGMRDYIDTETISRDLVDGQRHAVDGVHGRPAQPDLGVQVLDGQKRCHGVLSVADDAGASGAGA